MAKDILIDDDADLKVANGDFVIGNSDDQHVVLLVNTTTGSWKQFPFAGIGIIQYSASSGQGALLRRHIVDQMEADGFVNVEVLLGESDRDTFDYYITGSRNDGI